MLMSLVAGFLYLRRNNLEFLYNKQLWSLLAVMFCFIFVSGQMWNHIRSPPFVHKSSTGGVSYIHGSSQGQLVVETYIVMFLSKCFCLWRKIGFYNRLGRHVLRNCIRTQLIFNISDAMIVLGMIMLTESGSQTDMKKGRIMAIVGLVLVSVFFSLILSVFRTKAQGYPYR